MANRVRSKIHTLSRQQTITAVTRKARKGKKEFQRIDLHEKQLLHRKRLCV